MNPVYQIVALIAAQDSSREILFRTICIPIQVEAKEDLLIMAVSSSA